MALALQYVQQNPTATTNTVEFQSLGLDNTQLKNLAYQLIEIFPFVGKWFSAYTNRGPRNTSPVEVNQVAGIKKYLKAFIDVDCSPLKDYFDNYNAADAQRTFICKVINRRDDMLTLYYDYKRDVVERTHAVTTLPSPSPTVPARRDTGLRGQVCGRDGGICRITGVADRKYWEGREANVGFGIFKGCQVAHVIPWSVGQPYWELVRRLLGTSGSAHSVDIPENAMLMQHAIHDFFGDFYLYFDRNFIIRCRNNISAEVRSHIMSTVHVCQGVRAFDGGFLSIPITTPEPSTIRGPDYVYFLLHRLIGDIVWMAGGAEMLGENKFQDDDDDDPWTESHLVSPFSISFLDERLERLQTERKTGVL